MAIEAKKYLTPLIYKGEPVTFPTFGSQVFLSDGKPLETDGKIRALSSNGNELDDTLEAIPIDADMLGGVSADEYALKSDLESIDLTNVDAVSLGGVSAAEYALKSDLEDYALKFENWSDEEKTAVSDYVIAMIANARGVGF